ncbi:MAG: FAD binding domain-containing protein [Deltaproteobacteria bacterium]|nr:FAD binding domain-containing protein [Deltaproteobacteria bacterium]
MALGSLCTLRTLETPPLKYAPLLAKASRQVATIRIRSMTMVGGALAHADSNEDLPLAIIAHDARVRLRCCKSMRFPLWSSLLATRL